MGRFIYLADHIYTMVQTFITSDTHFNHITMIKEGWRNFKTVKEMNSVIINQWNSAVAPGDTVYHLGDVFIGKRGHLQLLSRLNGNIIFIKGNHDSNSLTHVKNIIIQHKGKDLDLVHNPADATFMGDFIIHGHIHKNSCADVITRCGDHLLFNVNCELHKFKPVALNNILGLLLHFSK